MYHEAKSEGWILILQYPQRIQPTRGTNMPPSQPLSAYINTLDRPCFPFEAIRERMTFIKRSHRPRQTCGVTTHYRRYTGYTLRYNGISYVRTHMLFSCVPNEFEFASSSGEQSFFERENFAAPLLCAATTLPQIP